MYFIYADESGDYGLRKGGTDYLILSGIIIHESHWNEMFQKIVDFRRHLKATYGIPQRIELHAAEILSGNGDYHHSQHGLRTRQRLDLYKDTLRFLASQAGRIYILNVCIRKNRIIKRDMQLFEFAWTMLIQRFHNTIDTGGYLAREHEYGLLIPDTTQNDQLRGLLRRMRAFNYVPSKIGSNARNILVTRVLDDPWPRDSKHSYFIQMADMAAFALGKREYPSQKALRLGFDSYFNILNPVLLTQASASDPQGIVYWPK
jgi:hypothetical protein